MQYNEFIRNLKQKGLQHVYLLSGEEHYYIEKAENALFDMLFADEAEKRDGLNVIESGIDIESLIGMIETAPFFVPKNVLLIRGNNLFKESSSSTKDTGKERFHKLLENMPEYSYVIFEDPSKADKRRKLYKVIEKAGAVLEAEPVKSWNIGDWLQDKLREIGIGFDREAYSYFVEAVGMMQSVSLSYLNQELDKLKIYTDKKTINKTDLTQIFSDIPEISGFAMLDAVSAHQTGKAIRLLHKQVENGVYQPVLLGMLAKHVKQLWQARELMDSGVRGRALGGPMGLNPFIAEKVGKVSMGFKSSTLKKAYLDLTDADYLFKTGQAGEELLESIIIDLCEKA